MGARFRNQDSIPWLSIASMANVPRTSSARSPLKRAKRIEKEVSGMSRGVSAATLRKAWESVTTNFGGPFQALQGMTKFPLFDDHAISITVEKIPDGLDLRQDQPAFRSLLINGNHEDRHLPSTDQITQNGRVVDKLHGATSRGFAAGPVFLFLKWQLS